MLIYDTVFHFILMFSYRFNVSFFITQFSKGVHFRNLLQLIALKKIQHSTWTVLLVSTILDQCKQTSPKNRFFIVSLYCDNNNNTENTTFSVVCDFFFTLLVL